MKSLIEQKKVKTIYRIHAISESFDHDGNPVTYNVRELGASFSDDLVKAVEKTVLSREASPLPKARGAHKRKMIVILEVDLDRAPLAFQGDEGFRVGHTFESAVEAARYLEVSPFSIPQMLWRARTLGKSQEGIVVKGVRIGYAEEIYRE